jgi:hypothetical protein
VYRFASFASVWWIHVRSAPRQSAHSEKPALYRVDAFVHRAVGAWAQFPLYHRGVGARTIRLRDDPARRRKKRRQESLTLWKIIGALAIPMLLALIFVAIDMRHELGEMKSSGQVDDKGAIPVGWPELEDPHDHSASLDSTLWDGRRRVRMIGYMMDGYHPSRDGEQVSMFILMPAAGQFLGAAHRIPNQMVEVRPRHPVIFKYRDLVWASGTLNLTIGSLGDEKATYSMSDAEVNPATERDIGKWFHP